MMFYYISEMFDLKGITQFVIGIILMVYASIQLEITWTLLSLSLLLITLFSAALVQISIIISASCVSFWVIDSWPVLGLAKKLREFAPYPMTIFNGAFRFMFTFILPVGFIAFYPSQFFLRPEDISPLVYFSPVVGIGLFAIAYKIWTKGINSYTGTGS